MSRRKLKSERELVADIRKVFINVCGMNDCDTCKYSHEKEDCIIVYLKDLLLKYLDEDEE